MGKKKRKVLSEEEQLQNEVDLSQEEPVEMPAVADRVDINEMESLMTPNERTNFKIVVPVENVLKDEKKERKPMSAEARQHLRDAMVERYKDPALRQKLSDHLKEVWTPERKAQQSEKLKSVWTPEKKAEHSEKLKKAFSDPVTKAKLVSGLQSYQDRVRRALHALEA